MPLDAIYLSALLAELRPELVGSRVDKVQQPQKDKILLTFRAGKLLLAAGSGSARLHLTEQIFENPQNPPMFCMLLRKHLTSAKLAALEQPPMERIVRLVFDTYNELGEPSRKSLLLELLGKNCNLILLDQDDIILDALRRVDEDMSRTRRILPGLRYHPPEFKGNPNVPEAEEAGERVPYLLTSPDGPVEFSYKPIHRDGAEFTLTRTESFSALLDDFYEARDRKERHRQQAGTLLKTVINLRDRLVRKLEAQRCEQLEAENRERYREEGDLITANLHTIQKGKTTLTTLNFYDPDGGEITISLDPLKTPQQNAAARYKRYTKAKTAERHLKEQIEKAEQELDYLNSVLEALNRAETSGDVAQIKEELTGVGLLRRQTGEKKQKPIPSKPLEFLSSTGVPIYAGKNNLQNDRLTFKQADRHDTWLHTQKIHGSHVIIATGGKEPDDATLEEAATIAAWYSQGNRGTRVPVDYTLVKHVKKPSGGKPGAVHYVSYKTIYANPDEAHVMRLKKEK
ncbi:MAG: NFACT family protein [Oscillospiraceae bacterium]|nr:NFACT family protein [Oscillospiraceae bacterium]